MSVWYKWGSEPWRGCGCPLAPFTFSPLTTAPRLCLRQKQYSPFQNHSPLDGALLPRRRQQNDNDSPQDNFFLKSKLPSPLHYPQSFFSHLEYTRDIMPHGGNDRLRRWKWIMPLGASSCGSWALNHLRHPHTAAIACAVYHVPNQYYKLPMPLLCVIWYKCHWQITSVSRDCVFISWLPRPK